MPKWAKPGDVCMFYFAKTADAKLRSVQRELDIRRGNLDWSTERCLDIMLRRGWHYFDKYSGTILAIGRVAGAPYHFDGTEELSHFKSPVYAEIDGIVALENPLHISEFRDVVFIKRSGTITPVFGREFDVVRERIMRSNEVPDYFANCSTKPIPLRGINKENWMSVAREHRTGFLLEQEFRACYVDYLLQSISDDGFVYRECRTKKKTSGKARKGFVDNVILFHGKYLPAEVKLNAEVEHNLPAQCERYCHLGNLFLTGDLSVSRRKVYGGNVLVVDTMALYMYSSKDRSIVRILELDSISEESLDDIKARLQEALNRAG